MKLKGRVEVKQLGIFLLLCLPLSWVLMGIGYPNMSTDTFASWAYGLLNLACFLPAIAAVVSSILCKESLGKFMLLPRLRGNGRVYFFAIAVGVLLSCLGNLLLSVVFPEIVSLQEEGNAATVVFMVLYGISTGCMQFFVLMGEEIGWMGYLFPRLEKLCGTTLALIFTGLIRSCWHIGVLAQSEEFVREFAVLCVSNLLLGSVLVLVTKASGSVVPAAVIHGLTNVVPSALTSFMVINDALYQANYGRIYLVSLIPEIIIGVGCYLILVKKYKAV